MRKVLKALKVLKVLKVLKALKAQPAVLPMFTHNPYPQQLGLLTIILAISHRLNCWIAAAKKSTVT